MAKLADALDLGSSVERRASSSLALGTKNPRSVNKQLITDFAFSREWLGPYGSFDFSRSVRYSFQVNENGN